VEADMRALIQRKALTAIRNTLGILAALQVAGHPHR
jgi:hypothetical protein